MMMLIILKVKYYIRKDENFMCVGFVVCEFLCVVLFVLFILFIFIMVVEICKVSYK